MTNPRERITSKDVGNIMGYNRSQALKYYRTLKTFKRRRIELEGDRHPLPAGVPDLRADIVFVDDMAEYTGLSRSTIKEGLVN